jgi:hypothetical protein
MLRLGLLSLAVSSFAFAAGCCCGPCGYGGGGYGVDPLAADQAAPMCGGCGNCIHCRRAGALQAARNLVQCHYGCGDLYYDEWFSDPAAPHDPCDYGYCPGPFRRMWWNLVALHTAPHPGCYQPTCGATCCADGDGFVEEGYADDGFVAEDGYYDGEYPADMNLLPAGSAPYSVPQTMPSGPRSEPRSSETIEKAQRPVYPPFRTSGLRIVPRGALARGAQ